MHVELRVHTARNLSPLQRRRGNVNIQECLPHVASRAINITSQSPKYPRDDLRYSKFVYRLNIRERSLIDESAIGSRLFYERIIIISIRKIEIFGMMEKDRGFSYLIANQDLIHTPLSTSSKIKFRLRDLCRRYLMVRNTKSLLRSTVRIVINTKGNPDLFRSSVRQRGVRENI